MPTEFLAVGIVGQLASLMLGKRGKSCGHKTHPIAQFAGKATRRRGHARSLIDLEGHRLRSRVPLCEPPLVLKDVRMGKRAAR
ncbi:hypothetical protein LZ31DRAFT_161646 [Colletotrichum somersetense]|nr:hypothetical protein LZ31DRAFT_161646 [Colletotrichum somersetense]